MIDYELLSSIYFSTALTSGEEDDLACSFKTVIHRPAQGPHFYLASNENLPMSNVVPPSSIAIAPTPLMGAPPPLPVIVIPSPSSVTVNMPIHHRAHTDSDLRFYNQVGPPVYFQTNWYSPYQTGLVLGPPPPTQAPGQIQPPPPPALPGPYLLQSVTYRSSSADCRHTVNNIHEPHVVHPERVW